MATGNKRGVPKRGYDFFNAPDMAGSGLFQGEIKRNIQHNKSGSTFGEALKEAVSQGLNTFEWGGKLYKAAYKDKGYENQVRGKEKQERPLTSEIPIQKKNTVNNDLRDVRFAPPTQLMYGGGLPWNTAVADETYNMSGPGGQGGYMKMLESLGTEAVATGLGGVAGEMLTAAVRNANLVRGAMPEAINTMQKLVIPEGGPLPNLFGETTLNPAVQKAFKHVGLFNF